MSFGNLFAGSQENNKVRSKGLPKGSHLVAINSIGMQKTRSKGRMAEFRYIVLQTNNPAVSVGDEFGEVFYPEDTSDPDLIELGRGRLRALVRAIAGLPQNASPEEVSKAWDEMVGDGNPARGVKTRVTGTDQVSKKGNAFVAIVHESVDQTEEEIAETRRLIENAQIGAKSDVKGSPGAPSSEEEVPAGIAARLAGKY